MQKLKLSFAFADARDKIVCILRRRSSNSLPDAHSGLRLHAQVHYFLSEHGPKGGHYDPLSRWSWLQHSHGCCTAAPIAPEVSATVCASGRNSGSQAGRRVQYYCASSTRWSANVLLNLSIWPLPLGWFHGTLLVYYTSANSIGWSSGATSAIVLNIIIVWECMHLKLRCRILHSKNLAYCDQSQCAETIIGHMPYGGTIMVLSTSGGANILIHWFAQSCLPCHHSKVVHDFQSHEGWKGRHDCTNPDQHGQVQLGDRFSRFVMAKFAMTNRVNISLTNGILWPSSAPAGLAPFVSLEIVSMSIATICWRRWTS